MQSVLIPLGFAQLPFASGVAGVPPPDEGWSKALDGTTPSAEEGALDDQNTAAFDSGLPDAQTPVDQASLFGAEVVLPALLQGLPLPQVRVPRADTDVAALRGTDVPVPDANNAAAEQPGVLISGAKPDKSEYFPMASGVFLPAETLKNPVGTGLQVTAGTDLTLPSGQKSPAPDAPRAVDLAPQPVVAQQIRVDAPGVVVSFATRDRGVPMPFAMHIAELDAQPQLIMDQADRPPTGEETPATTAPALQTDLAISIGGTEALGEGANPMDPSESNFSFDFGARPLPSGLSDLGSPVASRADMPHPSQQTAKAVVECLASDPTGRLELTLTPDDLGKLRFDMRGEGDRLAITLFVERPETLDLIRRNLPDLLDELKQAGVQAGSLAFGSWGEGRQSQSAPGHGPDRHGPDHFADGQNRPFPPPALLPDLRQPLTGGGLDLRL